MSPGPWLVAALLLVAAILVGWPLRSARARRRALVATMRPTGRTEPSRTWRTPSGDGGGRPSRWGRRADAAAEDPLVGWVAELGRALDVSGPLAERDGSAHRMEATTGLGGDPARAGGNRRTPAIERDADTRVPWPSGGSPGRSRPPGPSRPPGRRDGRGPTGLGGTPGASVSVQQRPAVATPAARPDHPGWSVLLTGSPRRTLFLAGLTGAGIGGLLAGPVAAVALAGYGLLGVRAAVRWQVTRSVERARRRRLDQLAGLAADLRAGLPVPALSGAATASTVEGADRRVADVAAAGRPEPGGRLDRLASAAVRLADRTGAPLAELLERIEADARSTDRGLAAAAAQAAGARATAWLLAALPLGGIGLGYGIGVDPVRVLLHTPIGAACTLLAVALQAAGLFWAERLAGTPGGAD
ncbi:type II secretion system F family protein [Micromonospora sp. NPDC051006]|uniref:type II secretion system F family protein n=1 Tax=Micromonospora sp. NPDC051006 TaxID=3364283 RepID=UPI00379CC9C6